MRLIRLASLFCALAWIVSAPAQVGQIPAWPPTQIFSGGFTPSCAQSSTFLAAATGVTLPADKTNYDTLICGLVSDGVWNFDVLYIWAAPDQATALINLANPGTFNGTTNGIVSFAAYQGFTGDGLTFYITTGFNPSTATSPNFVQNSATLGIYVLNARSSGPINVWDIGSVGGADGLLFSPYRSGNLYLTLNSTTQVGGGSPTSSQGAWNGTRTASTGEAVFLNSSENPISQTTDTSQAPLNSSVIFFALNPSLFFTTDQIAAGWIGKGVGGVGGGTGVDSCKINNRINTYLRFLQGQATAQNVYSNSAC